MKKRGLSPLIATVLLIGFTIVLASFIVIWGSSFMRKITAETSQTTNITTQCTGFNYKIDSVSYNRSNIILDLPFEEKETEKDGVYYTKDYSINNYFVTVYNNPFWDSAGGNDGFGAYKFVGIDDYLEKSNIETNSKMTIELWIKMGEIGSNQFIIDGKTNENHIYIYKKSTLLNCNTKSTYLDNNWNYIICSFGEYISLYKNGIKESEDIISNFESPQDIYIGRRFDNPPLPFNDYVDNIKIYNTVLTDSEIKKRFDKKINHEVDIKITNNIDKKIDGFLAIQEKENGDKLTLSREIFCDLDEDPGINPYSTEICIVSAPTIEKDDKLRLIPIIKENGITKICSKDSSIIKEIKILDN